MVLLKLSTL